MTLNSVMTVDLRYFSAVAELLVLIHIVHNQDRGASDCRMHSRYNCKGAHKCIWF